MNIFKNLFNSQNQNKQKILTATEKLAQEIISIAKKEHNPTLSANDLTVCDTIIFTSFFIRFCCTALINDAHKVQMFDNEYLTYIKTSSEIKKASQKYNADIFSDRVNFYQSIFMTPYSSKDDCINAFINEFENILSYDIYDGYIKYNEKTALLLIGVSETFQIKNDVMSFYSKLPSLLNKYIDEAATQYK